MPCVSCTKLLQSETIDATATRAKTVTDSGGKTQPVPLMSIQAHTPAIVAATTGKGLERWARKITSAVIGLALLTIRAPTATHRLLHGGWNTKARPKPL